MLRERRCFYHLIKKRSTPCFLHLSNPTERQRQRHTDRESVCIYTPPPSPPSSSRTPQESPSLTYFALPYPSFIPSSYLFLFPSLLHSTIYLSTPQPRRPRTANPKKQYPITSQCIWQSTLRHSILAWHHGMLYYTRESIDDLVS